jgi:MoaA/NifB/PqqE/SkfB family radical SAM enzyme
VPAADWSTAPRQVSVALTNACDLRCPYCYAPKHRARLEYEQLTEWLNELDNTGCFGVGFGGGEPTLHSDFARLCRFASKYTELAVTFTTHAHRINERLAAQLEGNVHFIRVSMDGFGSTYETLRGRAFHRLLQQLELIRALAPFGINFVVNAATFPDIDAVVALAIQYGASEFLLLPERATPGCNGIDDVTRQALREWVNTSHADILLTVSESDTAGLPTCDPLRQEKYLRSYAHIDASGFIKRSSFDDVAVRIGNVGISESLKKLQQMPRGT